MKRTAIVDVKTSMGQSTCLCVISGNNLYHRRGCCVKSQKGNMGSNSKQEKKTESEQTRKL